MDLLENLSINDLNEDQIFIVDVIGGIEKYIGLIRACGGNVIYVPSETSIAASIRNRMICEEYHRGISLKELSLRYKVTQVWIRKIVSSK